MLLLVVHHMIHRREITDHAPEAIYNNCSRDALSIFLWHGNPKRSKMSISLVGDTHPNLQQYSVYQEHSENESYKFMNVCMSREEHPTLNWILAAATPNYKLLVIPYTSITQQAGTLMQALQTDNSDGSVNKPLSNHQNHISEWKRWKWYIPEKVSQEGCGMEVPQSANSLPSAELAAYDFIGKFKSHTRFTQ